MDEIKFDLTKNASKAIGIRMPYDLIEALESMAYERGTTPPKLIRFLIHREFMRLRERADNPDRGA